MYELDKTKKIVLGVICIFIFFIFFYFLFLSAPINFPIGAIIKIEQGESLHSVSLQLKKEHIIKSRIAFEALVIIFDRKKRVISTDYYFENKLPVYEVAGRISTGKNHLAPIVVTIPEGFDNAQIADAFSLKLVNFNKNQFLSATKDKEGYLFPDTYFFLTTDNEKDVLDSINKNFEKKITLLLPAISASGKTEKEIIIMASIVEREAKGDKDREFISGILWRRLSIGMPLQVDAALETYKTKGLPQNPISNPGLEAIKSALYPQKSSYLYYLHDKEGIVHYAESFAEHVRNRLKYLP